MHVSPSNQFPIGAVMPISRRQELLEWANKVKKRYIIEDDYDSEFRYKGTYIAPLFTADKQDKVIYMNTFSKTLVPSFRISYMVLPPKLLEKYVETMSFYSCTVSSFEQHTLAHFISEGYFERHINRLRNYYSAMRKKILEAIKKSKIGEISEIIEYGSGTHFLLSLVTSAKEEDIQEAMELMDVHIRRYSDYCTNVPEFNPSNYIFVVNYAGITEDKLPEMISRLEQIFPECRGDA